VFSGVFTTEKVYGVGDKGSGDTTIVVQTPLEAFLNMSLRSVSLMLHLSGKKAELLGLPSPSARLSGFLNYQMTDYRNFIVLCTKKTNRKCEKNLTLSNVHIRSM
jgi:hypothetical protein